MKNFTNMNIFASCSPIQCKNVTNPAATTVPSTINVTLSVQSPWLSCNSACTQSTLSVCQNSSLLSVFAKGIAYGIKALYCTDQYLGKKT